MFDEQMGCGNIQYEFWKGILLNGESRVVYFVIFKEVYNKWTLSNNVKCQDNASWIGLHDACEVPMEMSCPLTSDEPFQLESWNTCKLKVKIPSRHSPRGD